MDKIIHFEIPSDNLQRAEQFYKSAFGWQTMAAPMPEANYIFANTVKTGPDMRPTETGAINGGLMPRDANAPNPILVIGVDAIEDALRRVRDAGGEVVSETLRVGDFGLYARFKDPEGNVLALWQNLMECPS
jgi:predicted enzyme related to lactoylglutathione lyase